MTAATMSQYLDESNRRFFRNHRAAQSRAGRTDIGYGGEVLVSNSERRMIAKYNGKCTVCGQQIAAGTEILWSKSNGSKHAECPEIVVADVAADLEYVEQAAADAATIADAADALLAEYDALVSADDLLDEYDAQIRARNLKNLQIGTYRVELSGRRDTDPVNLKITVDQRREGAFRFKQHESYDGVGRINADGTLQIWSTVDQTDPQIRRVLAALDVLLGSERIGKYGEAYARETGQCFRCGRMLKQEDSIERGLGRTCASKVEIGY